MRTGGLFQFMRFLCNLPRIMRLFDFGRNYAKNYASIIRQGLPTTVQSLSGCSLVYRFRDGYHYRVCLDAV